MDGTALRAAAWTAERPRTSGYYEVWDPRRDINRIVRVFRTKEGDLAVANFCRCQYAFRLCMWSLPSFAGTHWRGPLHVPDGLGPGEEPCLLPHCERDAS